MNRNYLTIWLIFILVFTAFGALFVYPNLKPPYNYFSKLIPWQLGLDLVGGINLIYNIDLSQIDKKDWDSVAEGLRSVMEKRTNLFGAKEPNIALIKKRDGYRLVVELAGIKDVKKAVEQIGKTAFLDFRETKAENGNLEFIKTELNGRYLKRAAVVDSFGQPQVSLEFNFKGAKLFEEITSRNIGKALAIFIDDEIISAPQVREKIVGGNAVITGLNAEEAKSLANLLNAGALPAPIKLESQQLIGASLGEESLKKSIKAGFIGLLLIVIFMVLYYRSFGIFASLALIIYTILTLAVFKLFQMTMTLAGIAGFILSIGMAIDANILIFERTKEELKKGLSKIGAIEEGFKRAWPSIRDSNITTIITAIILYYFTTSFVKGFALALLIGVLVSMFTALTITRVFLRVFYK